MIRVPVWPLKYIQWVDCVRYEIKNPVCENTNSWPSAGYSGG